MLITCQAGFETMLARELVVGGAVPSAQGPGWVLAEGAPVELAFAHLVLHGTTEVRGESVNALAQQVADVFLKGIQGQRIDAPWPLVFAGPAELVGLGRRVGAVEKTVHELLRKRFSRVAKLAVADVPRGVGEATGLFVWFTDFGCAQVARRASINGQRRMADDAQAPSRSYLKVEEGYVVLGQEPAAGETVVDLGAAPGGWSYSAARHGARVLALDNGPLKGGALDHPLIEHRHLDAFGFTPTAGTTYDWLFCDLVEEPHHVLRHLIEPWLANGWCRQFVVNLKFGRVDALALLQELRAADSPLRRFAPGTRIRHLYHDREEFTLVGKVITSSG
ncbi:MAG: rRNA methyltransferase [Cephaloticoccus sp.]|nr:rRNA methyltransferase [Cephaloticoccus sp.]MCF7759618.1 rRNA methyltransferase [Cephaloticoccus sp.]